jgi:arylsulfatase A-like enzyme
MILRPLLLLLSLFLVSPTARAAEKLNVVFILADDLGWGEIGSFGQKKIPTPHLDRLAAQGTRLTQHYSGAPVCAPSRCVLMTGKHLGHAEVRGNLQAKTKMPQFDEGQYPLTAEARTWPQLLQSAGYATGAMGKWGLGPVGSTGDPARKGFDLFFGYNCQAVAHSFYPATVWRNAEKVPVNAKPISGHSPEVQGEVKLGDWIGETYAPKLMVAEAEKFIATNKARPFLLYLPFIEPHVAMHPPRETVEKFPAEWDPEPYRGGNGYLPHPRPRAGYAAMIAELDDHVGKVLAALDQAGVAERTLVIFTSDNGTTHEGKRDPRFHVGGVDPKFFNSTAALRGFKGSVYEGGIRVPTIARLPGRIPAGVANDTPGYFADWFPTVCDVLGMDKPDGLDGESLWPALTSGKTTTRTKPMLWVFPEYGGQVAVRIGDFKLVRQNLKPKGKQPPGAWEVYHLSKDRSEAHDLAASRADLIAQAEEILRREVAENAIFPLAIPNVNAAAR